MKNFTKTSNSARVKKPIEPKDRSLPYFDNHPRKWEFRHIYIKEIGGRKCYITWKPGMEKYSEKYPLREKSITTAKRLWFHYRLSLRRWLYLRMYFLNGHYNAYKRKSSFRGSHSTPKPAKYLKRWQPTEFLFLCYRGLTVKRVYQIRRFYFDYPPFTHTSYDFLSSSVNLERFPLHSNFKRFDWWQSLNNCLTPIDNDFDVWLLRLVCVLRYYRYYFCYDFLDFVHFCGTKSPESDKVLLLNFRRFRFFPSLQDLYNHVYSTVSLGVFSKFLYKGKAFIKNKLVYLMLASFFRKLLTYSAIENLILLTKRTPIYFREILSTLNTPVDRIYKHPFKGYNVEEVFSNHRFLFSAFIFVNSRSYSYMKPRKKGRLKRKITKRIISMNKLVD